MSLLETERLILRNFMLADWEALNAMVSDSAVTCYMHLAAWDEERRRGWLSQMVQEASSPPPSTDNWAITLRSGGQLIGWLYIGGSREAVEAGTRGCGYALDQRYWGQGYMTEALRAAFTYEFTVLGTQRITAECETPNTASARVMQKCGMTNTGTFYDADFEGNWRERHHFTITTAATDTP